MKDKQNAKMKRVWVVLVTLIVISLFFSAQAESQKYFFDMHLAASSGSKLDEARAEILKGEFAKIGINLVVDSVDFTTILARARKSAFSGETWKEGGFDSFFVLLAAAAFDPAGITRYYHTKSKGAFNVWNFFDPLADNEMSSGDSKLEVEKRKPHYQKAMEILFEKHPLIVLEYPKSVYVFRAGWEGFKPYIENQAIGTANFWQMTFKGKPSDRLIIGSPSDIRSPNSLFDWTGPGKEMVGSLVHESLVEITDKLRPEKPALAKSWEFSKDGKMLVFRLRNDVSWHDGVKFTSKDVKFTYEARMDKKTGAEQHSNFRAVESVEAPDDFTIVIKFKEVFAPALLEIGTTEILPAHIFKDLSNAQIADSPYSKGSKMIPGLGPYQIIEWKKGEKITLKSNKNYWRGVPSIETIIWTLIPSAPTAVTALEAGELDGICRLYNLTEDIARLKKDPRFTVFAYNSLNTNVIGINNAHPILKNPNVKKAISYAIPRERICATIAFGLCEPGSQFLGPWSFGHNPELPEIKYDINQSKKFMEKAGFDFKSIGMEGSRP